MNFCRFNGVFLVLLWCAPPAKAALRFGLGDAVAKRSADLIDKAGDYDAANATGDAVAATLASCPSGDIYDAAPTDLSQVSGIDPLGHVAPSPHTFPADHIYFYISSTAVSNIPIYAPGNIHITRIASSEIISVTPPTTDYGITFYACREVKSYYAHVLTLSPSLQNQVGAIDQDCSTYTTGATFRACNKNTNIVAPSGTLLGYSRTSGAFDFGTFDYRRSPLAFVTPSRHLGDTPYAACAINYFTPGLKMTMEAMLGRFDGGYHRVTAPICGQTLFDIAGTAKGAWYHPGSPDIPEDPHLSLIDNNVTAPQQTISIGNSLPNYSPNFITFDPVSAGRVDRDFSQVTADGNIYCYDSFFDPMGQPANVATFLIQMLTPTTLRFEKQNPLICGAPGSWAFTSNAVDYQR